MGNVFNGGALGGYTRATWSWHGQQAGRPLFHNPRAGPAYNNCRDRYFHASGRLLVMIAGPTSNGCVGLEVCELLSEGTSRLLLSDFIALLAGFDPWPAS